MKNINDFINDLQEIIAKAKRQIDLDNSDAIMEDEEMYEYIEKIGREELFDEIKDLSSDKYMFVRHNCPHPYPRYLKAIRVSLIAQGYDQKWVETKFRYALEDRYFH